MVLEEQEDIVVARISVRCFRLLALVSEVQNEVEVVKPILQELEVMRLSCALGMLANVNAKDFEHDMLEASEFDDDFARFLRQELFGGRNGDDDASASHHVSVTSAFGKQSEVKYHLQKLNAWDDDMERHLRERDQGIYAVLLPDDTMSDEVASPKLVLFGWLVDCLFEPEHLRDTPTYILRFLTCLSSNVTCCLSTKDCLSLQAVVSAMDSSDMDDWKSYSVGFRVELAEDEKDSVRVNSVRSMELPTVNGARQMRVIKGSFPGLAAVADVRREKAEFTSRLTFKDALALSNWLVERSTTSQVHVDSSQLDMKIREAVIVASNMWPDSKLEEIDIQYNAELVQAEEAAKMEIERVVSEEQVALMEAAKVLFCVDVLEDHKRTQEALDVVQTSLEALASVNTVLEAARDRFQEAYCVLVHVIREMRPTMVLFMAGLEDELCTSLQKPPNLYALSKAKNKWQNLRASLKSMCDGTPVGRGFRDRMMTPLETMREGWWASVAAILDVYRQKSLPFLVDKRSREVAISRESAARAAVDDAFQDLIGEWSRPHDSGSSLKIDARCRKGKIICACKEMTWVPQGERMLVWKLCSDKEPSSADALSMLGEFRLHGGETVMGVFSVQHTSLIVVSTSADRCFLRRVQFPLDPNVSKRRNRIVATEIRSFTRDVVLCDFSVENRMLALMDRNNNVGLLRFDEKFTFLEQTKTINVDERTSLVIPVVSIAVSDGMLYALDCEGSMQSVNLRSMQTSKKRCDKTLCSREDKWQSDLFFLQGEAVLGSLEATRHERDAVGKLHVMSIDDYRLLPEVEGASIKLAATEQLSAYVQGESLYVLDGCQLHIVAIHATIRSSSFRMQSDCANVDDDASQQTKLSSHWLWALYHLYEKFPVSGLLEVCCGGPMAKERTPMKLTVVIPAGDAQAAQDFVRVVMENLQKLNKPLYGLGLSGNLTVKQTSSCSGDFFSTTTTAGFLERMVTIVPIQICRAEYNSLTVMQNGQDQPDDFVDGLSNEHQSTEIAQSIRFGLLSPLLQSWGGQCVVITSMGKQSTGKSYFLNHLTGSSFAIAGARCTDGAWMCVRVLSNDVLLVVIDFEGLGSFERTEQEDVFLSVLNASISMLTVFRMEMRFDKEIDDLFSKFQKGSRLIKNDPLLFRGKLYMSVKDVNPNDQREIVREIVTKFRRLMDVNKEHSFLTDMPSDTLSMDTDTTVALLTFAQAYVLIVQRRIVSMYVQRKLGMKTDVSVMLKITRAVRLAL
ncbi:hypothetical protein Poli38472_009739 [Pythium oligandrum]|uniref:VLIG-type G domain-containing protein n=1 Tax=Pythium oligandrum TaxID=41045 RepID=A0A8K1CG69_PYTOL|nr:hypothetical protein Poli38472_009739 [Pythium oligandrum]|eukprot:TMW62246.1 hypothetical protein Poli38472_009739 [Pythium oligandrum]